MIDDGRTAVIYRHRSARLFVDLSSPLFSGVAKRLQRVTTWLLALPNGRRRTVRLQPESSMILSQLDDSPAYDNWPRDCVLKIT